MGAGRWEAGDGPAPGAEEEHATAPSPPPSPARSGRRPAPLASPTAPGSARSGRRPRAQAGAEVLPAARSPGAEDSPWRTEPGLEAPATPRAPAAPGKCAAPPPQPFPTLCSSRPGRAPRRVPGGPATAVRPGAEKLHG